MSEDSNPPSPKKLKTSSTKLRALGFCGADDSVHPNHLGLICQSYPFVEFGVLFRPDKEGQPRYATEKWVSRLASVAKKSGGKMQLAAHLCGSRVNEILDGDDKFVSTLRPLGFKRVQINATAVNGVDTSKNATSVQAVANLISRHKDLEFILQKNEETKPLWEGLLLSNSDNCGDSGKLPPNVTMLVDESKGTGVLSKAWPTPPDNYDIGYAGGIGPSNIKDVLEKVLKAGNGREVWIDMESSLRSSKNDSDVFDLDKCYECIDVVCATHLYSHPEFLC